ncbi:MAG TPA: TIGR02587 family membrane protein [Caldilineaceae bacterium]|nr:TIGR02587 family membrane protein [Caldilineaceae bacterium]
MAKPQMRTAGRPREEQPPSSNGHFWVGLGRAFAGALLFSISLLMTIEMWWLGFYMNRARLALFTLVTVALLIGLAHYRGFQKSVSFYESVIDAFVGYAVGVVTGAIVLLLFGVIEWGMSLSEVIGKIALQATAGSIGALLARGQLGGREDDEAAEPENYWAELFLMIAGALFVAYTVAPTEEMILIGYIMTPWHAILALIISLVIMHTFVYEVGFRGQHEPAEDAGFWTVFLRFTLVGYALVFLTSLYILWTFGRVDNTAIHVTLMVTVVLSLPGALGAAAARLIL